MGYVTAKITLGNPRRPDLRPLEVDALADSAALHLCLPERLAVQLALEKSSRKEATTADGKRHACSYVGPVRVQFDNRESYTGALVLGPQVLLGALPMEDMDVLISPVLRKLVVNPANPNFAAHFVGDLLSDSDAV